MHIVKHKDGHAATTNSGQYQSDKDLPFSTNISVSQNSSNIDAELATAISLKQKPNQSPLQDRDSFQLRSLDLLTDMSQPILLKVIKALFTNNGLDPYMVSDSNLGQRHGRVQVFEAESRSQSRGSRQRKDDSCQRSAWRRRPRTF